MYFLEVERQIGGTGRLYGKVIGKWFNCLLIDNTVVRGRDDEINRH
jgi:hypothetical protein